MQQPSRVRGHWWNKLLSKFSRYCYGATLPSASAIAGIKYPLIIHGSQTDKIYSVHTTTNMIVENYSPIMSDHDTNYYRVLLEQVNDTYTIHTGDRMTRILKELELPKEIRTKLAIIKAYENRKPSAIDESLYATTSSTYSYSFDIWSPMDMYTNSFPAEFHDVGWRCKTDREFYCVIMTIETLDLLRGEGSNGTLE